MSIMGRPGPSIHIFIGIGIPTFILSSNMGSKDDVVSLALSDDTGVSIHLHGIISFIIL